MTDTRRAALTLCPPPAVRFAAGRIDSRGTRLQTHLRPLLRKTSRALLRLADLTQRLGLLYAGLIVHTGLVVAATVLA